MPIGLSHHRVGKRLFIDQDNARFKNLTLTPEPSLVIAGDQPRTDRRQLIINNESSAFIFLHFEEEFELDDDGNFITLFPGQTLTIDLNPEKKQDIYARTQEFETEVRVLEVF